MGNPKQKWTSEEEEALRAGVNKYGPGKWKFIQKDPVFNKHLNSRSNIDLKDKWRNMSAAGQGSRDKSRAPKPKSNTDTPASSSSNIQTPTSVPTVAHESPADQTKDDPVKELPENKNGPKYNDMIFEVLSSAKDPNGLELGPICNYIENRVGTPQNFRKQLGSKLRRLVRQNKLEKVDSCYRIKKNSGSDTNTRQALSTAQTKVGESLEEAAKTAAYKVAEAENAAFLAQEAVREAERVAEMAEETKAFLELATEILEKCTNGEIFAIGL